MAELVPAVPAENENPALIDGLPNEVLLMILRRLEFAERLSASSVCHRWNRLIFRFLNDDVWLHLPKVWIGSRTALSEHRVYPHIKVQVDGRGFMTPTECVPLQEFLPEQVKSLWLSSFYMNVQGLQSTLRMCSELRSLEYLKLEVLMWKNYGNFQLDDTPISPSTVDTLHLQFAKGIRTETHNVGVLFQQAIPALTHLRIHCECPNSVNVLAKLAPTLLNLTVAVNDEVLDQFLKLEFPALKYLNLTLPSMSGVSPARLDFLRTFAASFENLKILRLNVFHCVGVEFFRAIYHGMTSVVDMEMNLSQYCYIAGLDRMVNLTRFWFTAAGVNFVEEERLTPLPLINHSGCIVVNNFKSAQMKRVMPNGFFTKMFDDYGGEAFHQDLQDVIAVWPEILDFAYSESDWAYEYNEEDFIYEMLCKEMGLLNDSDTDSD